MKINICLPDDPRLILGDWRGRRAMLELAIEDDGETATLTVAEVALTHRFNDRLTTLRRFKPIASIDVEAIKELAEYETNGGIIEAFGDWEWTKGDPRIEDAAAWMANDNPAARIVSDLIVAPYDSDVFTEALERAFLEASLCGVQLLAVEPYVEGLMRAAMLKIEEDAGT
jgi:hypothetical protein